MRVRVPLRVQRFSVVWPLGSPADRLEVANLRREGNVAGDEGAAARAISLPSESVSCDSAT